MHNTQRKVPGPATSTLLLPLCIARIQGRLRPALFLVDRSMQHKSHGSDRRGLYIRGRLGPGACGERALLWRETL